MIELLIINVIVSACVGKILATEIKPLQNLKYNLGLGFTRKLYSKNKYVDFFIESLHKLLNCNSCLGFWFAILIFNWQTAVIAYILGCFIGRLL